MSRAKKLEQRWLHRHRIGASFFRMTKCEAAWRAHHRRALAAASGFFMSYEMARQAGGEPSWPYDVARLARHRRRRARRGGCLR